MGPAASASPDIMIAMPADILFDSAAVRRRPRRRRLGAKAGLRAGFTFTDLDYVGQAGVLNARGGASAQAQFTVTGPKAALEEYSSLETALDDIQPSERCGLTGRRMSAWSA
jgi:hypothetical protein